MIQVRFHDTAPDALLKFAVIFARMNGKYVFCRHEKRLTLEIPGGHREEGENIDAAASRELYEETGATQFDLTRVCPYSVKKDGEETFGMLYFAQIFAREDTLKSEIAQVFLLDVLPEDNWTYPDIQPLLIRECIRRTLL